MSTLLILNDPPYGNERSYNGRRLAKAGQKMPQGYDEHRAAAWSD